MGEIHSKRIGQLRRRLAGARADAVLIPTSDYHNSEYVSDHFKTREFFSGFTGSAGTLAVTAGEACLWTDGRYFVQAGHELEGSGVRLMKMQEPGVPTTLEYLCDNLGQGQVLCFDGRCVTDRAGREMAGALESRGIRLDSSMDPAEGIWTDRPQRPAGRVRILDVAYAGLSAEDKLKAVRQRMTDKGGCACASSRLDDLMWLLNLRGSDVECNPVALCHLYLRMEDFCLFLQEGTADPEVTAYIENMGGRILPYDSFVEYLAGAEEEGPVLIDPDGISYAAAAALRSHLRVREWVSPMQMMKAVKNSTELANLRECYRRDSAALCSFIYWLKHHPDISQETEYTAAMRLDAMRAELPDFAGLSFPTISAYGPNAAMMHYEADSDNAAQLRPEGMLLVDSGGQYLTGTTDVTRTMALGPVTEEMRTDYTLTAAGNLQLMDAVFLHGCTGRNLDILSREPLWKKGIDYKCGTGHGIGYYLNVHEAPPNIRWRFLPGSREDVIEPGMIVSDEPGVYIQDKFGIRIETILECEEMTENSDGRFLRFRPLTLVPLDRELLEPSLLSPENRQVLNDYHARVYEEIAPLLPEEEASWLREQTLPV